MTGSCARTLACALVTVLGLAACATPPGGSAYPSPAPAPGGYPAPPSPGTPLGSLFDIRGANAYYQRGGTGPVTRAYQGQPVYEGDRIFTGQGTRMSLGFSQGGHAELDEMTDPVPRFLSDLGCLIVDLLRTGRMFVDGSAVCVGAVGTIARQDSQVVYDVRRGYAEITVAGGRAELRRPQRAIVPAGWRVDANARTVMARPYQLTRSQVEDAVRWTRWYQQKRPALPGVSESGPLFPPVTRVPRPPQREPPAGSQREPVKPTQPTAPPPTTTQPPATKPPATEYTPGKPLPRLQRAVPQSKPSDTIR